jgi:hypothetical protein
MMISKAELLEHYATREPKHFSQFDGWREGAWDGDSNFEGARWSFQGSWELMQGADVRVLIPDDVTPTEAVEMLRRIIEAIEVGGFTTRYLAGDPAAATAG